LASLVVCTHNATVCEVPDDHPHRGLLVNGEAFDATKFVKELKKFGSGRVLHLMPVI
jgi:hypothetical protein